MMAYSLAKGATQDIVQNGGLLLHQEDVAYHRADTNPFEQVHQQGSPTVMILRAFALDPKTFS